MGGVWGGGERRKKKRAKNPLLSTFGEERTTLHLRQCWKAAELRIAVRPSANSFINLCPSLPSCIMEIVLNHTGAVKLNSKMSEQDLECLGYWMLHDCKRYTSHV